MRPLLVVGATALLAISLAVPASAYVRTTTCRDTTNPAVDPLACREGETPIPIAWDQSCIVYHVNEQGSSDVSLADIEAATTTAFDQWENAERSGSACTHLNFHYGGQTNETRIGYYSCVPSDNANVVMFINEGWRHQTSALALTSVTYDMSNGLIVDADIELNDQSFNFTTTDLSPLVKIDVRNTLTHEIGHLIGLDHTSVQEATMFGTAPSGEILKRDLHQDDTDAVCDVYPASQPRACSIASIGYFSAPAGGPGDACPKENGCNCRVAAGSAPQSGLLWAIAGLLGACVLNRRRGADR